MLLNPLFIYVAYQKFAVVSANGNMMDVGTAITIGGNRRGFRDRGTSALNGAGTGLLGLEKCMALYRRLAILSVAGFALSGVLETAGFLILFTGLGGFRLRRRKTV